MNEGSAGPADSLEAGDRPSTAALAELAFAASCVPLAATLPTPGAQPFRAQIDESLDLDLGDPQQSRFGDYTLLAKLGQGGMGVVYRAHQHSLDREVAVKLLAAGPWASPDFIERFRFEAQSAARMQHPNIVTIFDAGAQDGLPFFSMRFVRGHSLAERIRKQGPLAPQAAARLIRTVAEAVDYAHRLGILHLDLKPGNVLLDERDGPLVADFGLARQIEQAADSGSDEVSGTPSYMAPEQATLSQALSPATDVYALGATLFETLVARPPFRGATARETLQQVVVGEPPSLRSIDRRLPLDLQAICLKCLDKDPERRYANARELAEDLGRYLEGREVRARPLGLAQRGWRLVRREPRLSALAGLLGLALLVGSAATLVQWQRAQANADRARDNLWQVRTQSAQTALAEGDGFRGLHSMIANLQEMESEGRQIEARLERQRIGTVLANAPQLIDVLRLPAGESITSVAIAPDGEHFAIALHEPDGSRMIRQFEAASGEPLWTTVTDGLTHGLPHGSGMPHGWLRYTADGRLLLAGVIQQPPFAAPSHSDTVAVYAEDGAPLLPPEAAGDYADVLYSADGARALVRFREDPSARFPDVVQLFDTAGWTPLSERIAASQLGDSIDFHFIPDGSALLGTADFVEFRLLDGRTLDSRWRLRLPEDEQARAWRFSDDGRWLALGTLHGRVYLVSTGDGALRALPSPPAAAVRWLEFDSTAATLAAQAEDGSLMAWQTRDGRPRTSLLPGAGRGIGRLQLSGDTLISTVEERLRSWSLVPESPFDFAALPAPVQLRNRRVWYPHAFQLHAPARLLITGGVDGTLALWRMPLPVAQPWRAAPLPAGTLHFDGQHVVEVDGNTVRVREITRGIATSPSLRHPESVLIAELSHDARHLVTVAGRTLRVFDPLTGELRGAPLLLPQTPRRAELASAAPVIALTTGEYVGPSFHERLHVVDLDSGRARAGRWRIPGIVERLALAPDGSRALTLAVTWPMRDNDVSLWPLSADAAGCERIDIEAGEWPTEAEFAADGRSLWVSLTREDRSTRLARWSTDDCSALGSLELPSSGAFKKLRASGDGLVVSSLAGDEISVVDGSGTRRELPALPRFQVMFEMAVSQDGRRAAQATRNTVQVYDLTRGERLSAQFAAPIAGNDALAKLAFSPDAGRLLARSHRGRWMSWALPETDAPFAELSALAAHLDPLAGSASNADADFRSRLRGADPGPPQLPHQSSTSPTLRLSPMPGAAVDPRFRPLDLSPLHNVPLNGAWPESAGMGGDLATLAPGLHRFVDVDWRIEGGIQLVGGSYGIYFNPLHPRTAWLPFAPTRLSRVHVLLMRHVPNASRDAARDHARIVLRGVDGREHVLRVVHMRDVVQHAFPTTMDASRARGRIGWSGAFGSVVRSGLLSSSHTSSHAWAVALDVPTDAGPIEALRLKVAEGPIEAPLIYAITLEADQRMAP